MFPYRDENRTQRTPVVTLLLIAACCIVWIVFQGAGMGTALDRTVCEWGLTAGNVTSMAQPGTGIPMGERTVCVVDEAPKYLTIFTSMFLHGSWMHLLGNMWFLWLFGNNIEDSMTRPRFLVFYLMCGFAAALAQVWSSPASPVPMVGASGAISGVMGAYLILYPRVKVYTFVPIFFFFTTVALPAWVMLLYWIGLQVLGGFGQGDGGVAFWAHVGGFVTGIALVKFFARSDRVESRSSGWRRSW